MDRFKQAFVDELIKMGDIGSLMVPATMHENPVLGTLGGLGVGALGGIGGAVLGRKGGGTIHRMVQKARADRTGGALHGSKTPARRSRRGDVAKAQQPPKGEKKQYERAGTIAGAGTGGLAGAVAGQQLLQGDEIFQRRWKDKK